MIAAWQRRPAFTLAVAAGTWAQDWQEVRTLGTARSEMRAVEIAGKFYVCGGFGGERVLEVYDPAENSWATLRPAPRMLDHHMMAAYKGRLFVLKYARIYVYDPGSDTWDSSRTGSIYREDGVAVALGDYIYVIGGGAVRTLQRYSPDSNSWADLPAMQTARGHVSAVAFQGKIWVLAGRNPAGAHRSVEIYDPASGWSAGPPMQRMRSGFAAEVVNGKILVAGGEVPGNPWTVERSTEMYDPATGDWTFLADTPIPLHGVASVSHQGRFYLLAGSQQAAAAVNSNRAFYLQVPGSAAIRIAPRTDLRVPTAAGFFWKGARRELSGRRIPEPR
jgi:N-acetylneuraminic acid mutarotase